jgi:hypothetical protein
VPLFLYLIFPTSTNIPCYVCQFCNVCNILRCIVRIYTFSGHFLWRFSQILQTLFLLLFLLSSSLLLHSFVPGSFFCSMRSHSLMNCTLLALSWSFLSPLMLPRRRKVVVNPAHQGDHSLCWHNVWFLHVLAHPAPLLMWFESIKWENNIY